MRRPDRSPYLPATAVVLCLLGGCASIPAEAPAAWRIEPLMQVHHAAPSAQAYYMLGRYHDGSQDWERAVESYGKAVAVDPMHVEAYNALGVAWARLGRYAAAESALRRGLTVDPRRAHLHSNLGYMLLLAGRPQDAAAVLRDAVGLDAQDPVARRNLDWALSAAPAPAEAPEATTRVTDPASPVEHMRTASAAPALAVVDTPTVGAWSTDGATSPQPTASPPQGVRAAPAAKKLRLELSNGGGVEGAAARMKQWLAGRGLTTHRLTNQRPFVQRETVVQYRAGHQAAATRVAQLLGVAAAPQSADALGSDVRVLLGRDLERLAACMDPARCPVPDTLLATAGE